MKIAIINNFNGHFEVFGYLMYLFNKNHNITLFYDSNDKYKYISFFEDHFGKVEKQKLESLDKNYQKFNKIFVITMNYGVPSYFSEIKNKTYGIIHVYHRKTGHIDNYISLYPRQKKEFERKSKNKIFYYTFPFYDIPKCNTIFSKKKYILQIGTFWDDDDDFKNFKKNVKYQIIHFTRRRNRDIKKDMYTLSKYLQNTVFILGRKTWNYEYIYTGSLTLSFSFNVPIILPEFKQKEYGVPCITFKEKYSELIDYINNVNIDVYNNLLLDMENIKQKEIEKNRKLFNLQ